MGHDIVGPKLRQQRLLAEQKRARLNAGGKAKKPSTADLRSKIAKVKPMTRNGGKRGR